MEKPQYKKEYVRFRITSLDNDGNFQLDYSQELTTNDNLRKHLEVLSRSFLPYIHQIRLKRSNITNILIGLEVQAKPGFDGKLFSDKILRSIIKNNIESDSISDSLIDFVRKDEKYLYKHALYCLNNNIEILKKPIFHKHVSESDKFRASLGSKPRKFITNKEKKSDKKVRIIYK